MTTTPSKSRARKVVVAVIGLMVLVISACGGDPVPISVPANSESAAQPGTSQVAPPPVSVAETEFGDILVNASGFSLYGFTDDVDGTSTCSGGCANAWPPVLVDGADLPAGLDADLFSVVPRDDGTHQLKAGKWPLYLFAGDTAAGQTTGHLSGDVWFLAAVDGSLIGVEAPAGPADEPAEVAAQAPALASVASSSLGDILVSGAGLTLYGFTNDVDGIPTCEGGCAEAWPPILVTDGQLPADLDPAVFSVVTRPDGDAQLRAGVWPLYLFAGDTTAGQTTGHLSGDVWFAVSPTGALIDGPSQEEEPDEVAAETETADAADATAGNVGYGQSSDDLASASVSTTTSPFGEILVDDRGLSLYGFTNDVDGAPTCDGGCAEAWPPVLVEGNWIPAGLDEAVFSVVARNDGSYQLKAGAWPLYRFAGDTAAGQTTGHLSGDVWFLASPTGGLLDLPTVEAQAAAPPVAPAPTAAAIVPTPTPVPPATPTPLPPAPTPTPYGYSSDSYSSDS